MRTEKLTENMIKKSRNKREKQTRYLSQAVQLEEAVNPHIIKATMTMVSLAILVFIVWAGFTNINEVARTPGEVVPQGYQQTVQHLEGGIVKTINVHEGEVVEQNEVLLVLDGSGVREDLERAQSRQVALDMQEERLRAFVEGRKPNFSYEGGSEASIKDQEDFFTSMSNARETEAQIVKEQIIQKKQAVNSLTSDLQTARGNHKITNDLYKRRKELNKKGYASDVQLLENERRLNEIQGDIRRLENQISVAKQEITEYEGRFDSLSARHLNEINEKLDQIIAQKSENIEIIHKLKKQTGRLQIRAPARGLIKGLSINTVGAVIQPGQTLMEIVPLGKILEVQVKISPKDIGHLKVGQLVQVKFSTFDFSRYGSITGALEQISATTFSGENGERYYQGHVSLEKNHVGDDPANIIMPGMTVMADIITGDKTILQYLLRPIHRAMKTAFTER